MIDCFVFVVVLLVYQPDELCMLSQGRIVYEETCMHPVPGAAGC